MDADPLRHDRAAGTGAARRPARALAAGPRRGEPHRYCRRRPARRAAGAGTPARPARRAAQSRTRAARVAGHGGLRDPRHLRVQPAAVRRLRFRPAAAEDGRSGGCDLVPDARAAGLHRPGAGNPGAYVATAAALAHRVAGGATRTDHPGRTADRQPAVADGGRGDRLPGRHRAQRLRRQRVHRGPGQLRVPARVRRDTGGDPAGRTHRQRVHRADRRDEGQRGDRRHPRHSGWTRSRCWCCRACWR